MCSFEICNYFMLSLIYLYIVGIVVEIASKFDYKILSYYVRS